MSVLVVELQDLNDSHAYLLKIGIMDSGVTVHEWVC
jgi:hypothetical protein